MKAGAKAFTLVELLMAAVITLVLAGLILRVTVGTLDGWRRTQDAFTTGSQAMLVLDYLERDLQGAVWRANGQSWLEIDVDYPTPAHGWLGTGPIKPDVLDCLPMEQGQPRLTAAKFGRTGAWLRLVTSDAPTTTSSSLPLVVGYQLVRRSLSSVTPVDPATIRYSLFRTTVSSTSTFAAGYDVRSFDSQLAQPDSADVLATNVIDFGVWLYSRDAAGRLVRLYPTETADVSYDARSPATVPVAADVFVRILTDEGAAMISAVECGVLPAPPEMSADAWWWSVAGAHSNTYVRRVELRGTGL